MGHIQQATHGSAPFTAISAWGTSQNRCERTFTECKPSAGGAKSDRAAGFEAFPVTGEGSDAQAAVRKRGRRPDRVYEPRAGRVGTVQGYGEFVGKGCDRYCKKGNEWRREISTRHHGGLLIAGAMLFAELLQDRVAFNRCVCAAVVTRHCHCWRRHRHFRSNAIVQRGHSFRASVCCNRKLRKQQRPHH